MRKSEVLKYLNGLIEELDASNKAKQIVIIRAETVETLLLNIIGAVNIINRQQAEIEMLTEVKEQLESDVINANMNLEHMTAEVERLQNENDQFADIGKLYSEIKAEAIKEFNASIYCYKTNIFIKGEELIIIPMSDYDNLVKEMAGVIDD